MKIIFLVSSFCFGIGALAAVPSHLHLPTSAEEILIMPEKNRYLVAESRAEELYPVLIQISKSEKKSMSLRWKALTLAAHLKKEGALPEIESALKSPEWFMRNAGLIALQSFSPEKAKVAAKALLKDKALVVRSAAVEVLGPPVDSKMRDLFWEEMGASYNFHRKQGLWVREQLLAKLAFNPEKKEVPLFIQALRDNHRQLHQVALAALEKATQIKLGKGREKLGEKRQLWIKWAQNNPNYSIN